MTFDQIMALLDKGLTADQIMALREQPAAEPDPAPDQEQEQPAGDPAPAADQPDGNAAVLAALDKLTKTVQAAALFGAHQPERGPEPTSADILTQVIDTRAGYKPGQNNR